MNKTISEQDESGDTMNSGKNNELKNEKGENKKDYLLIAVDVFIIVTIIIGFLAYKKRSKKDDV